MVAKSNKNPKTKRVVLGVTGSIAAYRSADIIRRLQDKHYDVTVIMTKGAQKFITPLTLGSLAGKKVLKEMFDEDDAAWEMSHIALAQADCLLIAPATANIIGKLACGLADDLLTASALATKAKILVAPAMNVEMYNNKIVKANCAKLKASGVYFIEPVKGKLACGVIGEGHLADVEDIVKAVDRFVQ